VEYLSHHTDPSSVNAIIYSPKFSDGGVNHILHGSLIRNIDLDNRSAKIGMSGEFPTVSSNRISTAVVQISKDDACHAGFSKSEDGLLADS
jgi:hypothetical protein